MNGKTILITGVSSGIGRAAALRSLHDGYRVVGTSRRRPDFEHSAFSWVQADLFSPDAPATLRDAVRSILAEEGQGTFRGFVHAAGASLRSSDPNDTADGWQRSMALHATAPMALYSLLESEIPVGGSVVLVGSPVAVVGSSKPAYSASKGALTGLCSSLATRGGARGIRVNVVLPGPTITGMTSDWSEEKRQAIAAGSALGRLCTPDEIAGVIAFLLSDDSSCVTGAAINATGGAHRGIGQ
jgi:NAD(P)-dependent dehydrogenase (short-subunit alcohol dehydrogenase family)